MSAEFFTASGRLLGATANGVYQGILIAAIAGLALRLFSRTNAATRHAVWFGLLLLVTALIPAHLLLDSRSRPETPPAPAARETVEAAPPLKLSVGNSPVTDNTFSEPESGRFDAGNFETTPFFAGATPRPEAPSEDAAPAAPSDPVVTVKPWTRFTSAVLKPFSRNRQTAVSLPRSICLGLISAWILLASVRAGLIVRRIGEVRRVKKTSGIPSEGLQRVFESLRSSLAARRNVRLRVTTAHHNAAVLGFVHPVVLLPAEMDTETHETEVEHVLRHELAHVDRRDDWGNLAQQVIQAALFFHPAVWWVSTKLSLEREIACDDHVLHGSGRPRAYALTLANVASRMNHCRHLLAPGVSNNISQLQQRITMILNTHRNRSPRLAATRLGLFTATTAILAVLAIAAGPRLVLAQSALAGPVAPEAAVTPPPAPAAVVADAAPATLQPDSSGSESGPRYKAPVAGEDSAPAQPEPSIPATPPEPSTAPDAPEPPSASVPLVAPVAPFAPMVAIAPMALAEPDPAAEPPGPGADSRPGPRPAHRHMSVEERLDRIERMLDDLEARGQIKGRRNMARIDAFSPGKDEFHFVVPDVKVDFDAASKNFAEQAKRMADQAQRAADAGQRAAEKAVRDLEKLRGEDDKRLEKLDESQASAGELEALRSTREALGKEMEKLSRQIKHLEEQRDRLEKPGRSDDSDAGQKRGKPDPE